jgi:hypothetical protein
MPRPSDRDQGTIVSEPGATSAEAERRARLALGLITLGLVAAVSSLNLPRAAGSAFWGDAANYYAMASSLAFDLDLRFEARDLERVQRDYPEGPQGVFLKRASGGLTLDASGGFPWVRRVRKDEGRLYYAKAFAYPLVAAPFVRFLGIRGLLVTNALALSLALWLGYGLLRRRGRGPGAALLVVLVLAFATVLPLYLVWPMPEVFGFFLVTAGLAAWGAGRPILSAVLFGVAGYVKPPNVLMAAPLGLEPLLTRAGQGLFAGLGGRVLEAVRRGAVLGLTALAFYALNAAFTGEMNYQGGERKSFDERYPFDTQGTSFDSAGTWMTTDHLGPLVEGKDEEKVSRRTGPARNPAEIGESFAWNLLYFWIGRFGGVLGYFAPALMALLLFALLGPRRRAGWLALAAVVLSWLAYIWVIPDNWYGGGGTVGNRYFVNLLPAFLLLVPPGRERLFAAIGAPLGLVFVAPILAAPVQNSLHPGEHATRLPYTLLPAELTMLNDLSVFVDPWRKKRPFGFVGDPGGPRHADPDAYLLYFLDDGTWGKESFAGREGFWLRAGARAEVVLRAFDIAPVEKVVVRLVGGPRGDVVSVGLGSRSERVRLAPGQVQEVVLPSGRGLRYYDTFLQVLRFRSRRGGPLPPEGRLAGAFVEIRLVTGAPFHG